MQGLQKLTGNKELGVVSEKANAVSEMFPLFALFRRSKKDGGQVTKQQTPTTSTTAVQATSSEPGARVPKPPPSMPTTPPPRRLNRAVSVPPSGSLSRQKNPSIRPMPSPPPQNGCHAFVPRSSKQSHSDCIVETRRDSVTGAVSSCSTLSRPPLPARPRTDGPLLGGSTDQHLRLPPPLPPRSPVGKPQAPAKPHGLQSSTSSAAISTLPVTPQARRPSVQSPTTAQAMPQLANSPATIASRSSPPTPAGSEIVFPASRSPSNAHVEKWLASTAAASTEMHNLSTVEQSSDSSSMSFIQRRRMFESSPIMTGMSH